MQGYEGSQVMVVHGAFKSERTLRTARKFGAILGSNAGFAWALTFNYIELWMGGCDRCDPGDVGGYTYNAHQIRFSGLSDISELRRRNHVVHELGHAFKWLLHGEEGVDVYSELSSWRTGHPGFPDRETFTGTESETGPNSGFASRQNIFTWQQSLNGDDSEEFADQFLGWVFNRWETSASGYLSLDGQARADMMSANMPSWVSLIAQP